ncbi:uncharacterized protein LOC120575326 [Perca fluviatilis]|uniref:uncharacterized protein LOC120575326 n=1 Tax=Perca fluviatilis TaxID=8168 RepID=UPI001964D30C|nr:uncharacterized protein LOC120575326 [Perca fluviatilis]
MQTASRGICGASQWSAARETARRASKLDEEGIEVVVCRHGVLLKALNMYRGEIFAYPLFLQKELQTATNGQFFCTDIACKYWPYLEKLSVSMSELRPLLQMRPFLSVMHAKAHSTKCETCEKAEADSQRLEDLSIQLGCLENMVHQWVHDVREWASDDSAGTRCDDQQPLQESIEEMFLAVHHRKASLYNQTDSNKIRQLRRRKLGEEKKKLFEKIKLYNEQVADEERILEEKVESRLSVVEGDSGADCLIWPWEVHSRESSNILTKKKIFDVYMSKMRLQEEKIILMREMKQHCTYLRKLAWSLRKMMSEMSSGRNSVTLL